jgi:hypothetical protein
MKEIIESKPAKKEEVSIDLKPKETEELPSAVSIEEVVTPSEEVGEVEIETVEIVFSLWFHCSIYQLHQL